MKFEIVKELSESTVVDVSGTCDSCFASFKTTAEFLDVEAILTENKVIVSVFAGSKFFKFSKQKKMIVCGDNDKGQIFFPRKEKNSQNSIKEIEVLLRIRHPCVCKAIGLQHANMNDDDDKSIESKPLTTIALLSLFIQCLLHRLIHMKNSTPKII